MQQRLRDFAKHISGHKEVIPIIAVIGFSLSLAAASLVMKGLYDNQVVLDPRKQMSWRKGEPGLKFGRRIFGPADDDTDKEHKKP